MKEKIITPLKVLLCIVIIICSKQFLFSQASIYYIDFESGLNSNNGLTPETAWQHCPGDPDATGNAGSASLQPGDRVLFRGGVIYRGGNIQAVSDGITYKGDAWPEGEKAIIEGTDILPGTVQACTFGEGGSNPNWQNIFCIDIPTDFTVDDPADFTLFTRRFFDTQTSLWVSRDPNMPEPYWEDDYLSYNPISNSEMTLTSITDPSYFTQPNADYWDGSYIMMHVNPNSIATQKVTGYDPTTSTIYYDTLHDGAVYDDLRNQYYSMINHIDLIDFPGEYYFDEANHRLYFWPRETLNPGDDSGLSVVWRGYAFDMRSVNDLVFEGFIIQKFIGGHAIYTNYSSSITIRNNEIAWIREQSSAHIGAIQLFGTITGLIENNYIHHTHRGSGIHTGRYFRDSENIIIRNNVITHSGYKGIWYRSTINGTIIENTLYENKATHGNAMSIFSCENVIVADNIIYN